MNNTNTGGPAFPCDRIATADGRCITSDGMTLRDYFAAKAMQSMALKYGHESDVSRAAYKIADAMLKARGA